MASCGRPHTVRSARDACQRRQARSAGSSHRDRRPSVRTRGVPPPTTTADRPGAGAVGPRSRPGPGSSRAGVRCAPACPPSTAAVAPGQAAGSWSTAVAPSASGTRQRIDGATARDPGGGPGSAGRGPVRSGLRDTQLRPWCSLVALLPVGVRLVISGGPCEPVRPPPIPHDLRPPTDSHPADSHPADPHPTDHMNHTGTTGNPG
jgi:hypothetical protein